MSTCPLPIDWLDLLAGRPSVATHAHLDSCLSCQAIVESLNDAETEAPRVAVLNELAAWARRATWFTGSWSDTTPTAGEIWWLAAEDVAARLLVLVLDVVEELTEEAFDVAPLWVDDDNAVPGDLLLNQEDSTVGIAWRVAFRHQTVVTRRALGSCAGSLTDSGKASLLDALTGFIRASSTGAALESDFDPRLSADAWMREPLMPAAAAADEEDLADSDPDLDKHTATGTFTVDTNLMAFVFDLTRKRVGSQASYRLAAAPPSAGKLVTEAVLHDHTYAIHIVARLWLDSRSDQLRLRPLVVSGLTGPVLLVLNSRHLEHPVEVETTLDVDEEVTLASGVGISEHDIESMEMQLR